jgi:hypothetical protein
MKSIVLSTSHGIIGIMLTHTDLDGRHSGTISTTLQHPDQEEPDPAIDAVESLILSHACAGVDVESPAYIEGIETALDAIANND